MKEIGPGVHRQPQRNPVLSVGRVSPARMCLDMVTKQPVVVATINPPDKDPTECRDSAAPWKVSLRVKHYSGGGSAALGRRRKSREMGWIWRWVFKEGMKVKESP